MFEGFTLQRADVGEAELRVRHGGSGPAVLLLHGHPRTHVTWHKVAPQHRYHDLWREQRDQEKHVRMLEFGAALPQLRKMIGRHLGKRGLVRERVLAAAVQLIDLGFFRPDGEEYAADNGSFGLATIRRDHVLTRRMWEWRRRG